MKGGMKILVFGGVIFAVWVIVNLLLLPMGGFTPNSLTTEITSGIITLVLFVLAVGLGRMSK